MSWLDQLAPASFRGVPFQVDTIDVTAGDNVVLREYPFADLPTVFRMGEGAEEIRFSAYVIGDDYHEQRERLREVLSGEGVLVHPTAGSLRVFVNGRYSISERPSTEGGLARFELSFVRAEPRRYPQGAPNTAASAVSAGEAAKAATQDQFAASWSLTDQPGWSVATAVQRVRSSVDAVWARISSATRSIDGFSSEIVANYQALKTGLDDLVRAPRELAAAVTNLYALPSDLSDATARDLQSAFAWAFDLRSKLPQPAFETSIPLDGLGGLAMFGTGVAPPGGSSARRAQLDALTAAGDQLFESLAVAAYVQATASVELANYDDAMSMRAELHAELTRLMTQASQAPASVALPTSSWHDAMAGLFTAGLADLQARSRDLVRLTTFTPQGWMPVWLVSYRLYGTADYADEILAMNPQIVHPLLVPPGRALRVVRHD